MTRREIEALGAEMLKAVGESGWAVKGVREEDDLGDEDDIVGSRGRCYYDDRLIWVNMRYADDESMVREILEHEIAHAVLGRRQPGHAKHDQLFYDMLAEVRAKVSPGESTREKSTDGRAGEK
jgi:hypothetical protein